MPRIAVAALELAHDTVELPIQPVETRKAVGAIPGNSQSLEAFDQGGNLHAAEIFPLQHHDAGWIGRIGRPLPLAPILLDHASKPRPPTRIEFPPRHRDVDKAEQTPQDRFIGHARSPIRFGQLCHARQLP